MKKTRSSKNEQVAYALRQVETGTPVGELPKVRVEEIRGALGKRTPNGFARQVSRRHYLMGLKTTENLL